MGPARKELVSTKEDNAVQGLLGFSGSFIFNIPQHTSLQAVIQPQEKYVGEAWSNSTIDTTLVRYLKVSTLWTISRYPNNVEGFQRLNPPHGPSPPHGSSRCLDILRAVSPWNCSGSRPLKKAPEISLGDHHFFKTGWGLVWIPDIPGIFVEF